jgi:hypothetical protein
MKIERFSHIYSNNNYNRTENPDKLNVFELSPLGVSWYYDGQYYEIINDNRVYALLLEEETDIAVVEAPFDRVTNDAYIVDSKGKIIWNVKDLFHTKYKDTINGHYILFDYPTFESSNLYFYVTINNIEYRFSFNKLNGNIGRLIESR